MSQARSAAAACGGGGGGGGAPLKPIYPPSVDIINLKSTFPSQKYNILVKNNIRRYF